MMEAISGRQLRRTGNYSASQADRVVTCHTLDEVPLSRPAPLLVNGIEDIVSRAGLADPKPLGRD
jgi:hypothetical protein